MPSGSKPQPPRSPLQPGQADAIAELLEERWGESLHPDEGFRVDASQVGERIFLSFVLESPPRGESLTLEAQLDLRSYSDPAAAIDHGMDALDALLGEYLEAGRELFFPVEWVRADFQGKELAYRGKLTRHRLEQEADRLLDGDGEE